MTKWKPHSYQLTAISFLLSNPKSGLFLDPGLGKTSTSLATIKILKGADKIKGVLMIAPLRVIYSVWPSEISKWSNFKGITHTILHGDGKSALWGKPKDIYLINPEGLPWLFEALLEGLQSGKPTPFDTLWIDESTKFKSQGSSRFKLLKDMLPLFKRRHIMTGTPAPRSLLDLWSQIYLLDEGECLTPNYHRFRNKYFQANDWNKYSWYIKEGSSEKIHNMVAPLVLEMSSKDYLNMPDISYNNINVELPAKALKHYKQMESEFFTELGNTEISAEATAQASMKCHQMSNGNVYENIPFDLDEDELRLFKKNRKTIHVHKAKIEILKELVDELNGKPLLIAYHYKHDLIAIRKLLGADTPFIGSGVTPQQTKAIEQDWNAGKLPILIGHPASMGHGLNLQASGNDICWFSLTWNLEEYLQFNARIYRQGVSGSVRVHHLVASETIDEAMLLRLGEKSKQQHSLREALKQYRLTFLS
tara:strand:+ start:1541 stop:2971 length:1431 start_codon:yes stop_codon:yes gene_type:complete